MRKQAGFTLIELIMVIVILGVLSAFALPRFADLGGEARTASINGLAGALRSSANIAHAQWLADGNAAATVSLEGTSVAMANGYPTIAGASIAAQVDSADYSSFDPGSTPADRTYYIAPDTGSGSTANCRVTYAQAAANGTPTVTVDVGGCN